MSDKEHYHIIEKNGYGEFRQKGSKFQAYAYKINEIEDVSSIMSTLKSEHPKANHHCSAYRLGINDQIEYSSDDREPSGSAGKPILGVIKSSDLYNILIVVVRYFGGTQLGVPGLINAYKEAAGESIRNTNITQKRVMNEYLMECEYDVLNELYRISQRFEGSIQLITTDISPVILKFKIPRSKSLELESALKNEYPLNKHCRVLPPNH